MLLEKTKTLTKEEVHEELEKLNSEKILKGAAVIGTGALAIKLLGVISPVVDSFVYGHGTSTIAKASVKFSKVVAFPYAFSCSLGAMYIGAFTVIALLILAISVRSKMDGESWGTIAFNGICVALPVVAWIVMELVFPPIWL